MRSSAMAAFQFQEAPASSGSMKGPEKDAGSVSPDSVTALRSPTFEYGSRAWAAGSRRAGRMNAAHVSDDELRSLLLQRQHLLDKKFEGSLTRQEELRLEYVRWSLDRIEDARHGEYIDRLESAVGRYEDLKADIQSLLAQLNDIRRGSAK